MVWNVRKVDIIYIGIIKLVDDFPNAYGIFDFINIINEDFTLHVIN